MSAATARAGVEVQYRATGVEAIKRANLQVSQSADSMKQRVGSASVQIASGFEMMARQGKLTGESMKQIANQGAQMAFMFGPQGAIMGAVAVLGVAMFSFWDRTRREMRETVNTGIEELERLARAGDLVGASRRQQELFTGSQFAMRKDGESDADFMRRRGGLTGVRARLAELRADPTLRDAIRLADRGSLFGSGSGGERGQEYRELLRHERELAALHRQSLPVVEALAEAEGRRATNAQINARDEKARTADEKARLKAVEEARKAADAVARAKGNAFIGNLGTPTGPRDGILSDLMGTRATINLRASGGNSPADLLKKEITNDASKRAIIDGAEQLAGIAETNFGTILGEGVANGFARAFSGEGIKGVLAGFGQTVMSAIGSLFQQMGAAYLQFGKIMSWATALYNPATAGAAGIALGIALMALGGALQGLAGGGGGRGGGYGGAASTATSGIIDRGLINPLNPLGGAQYVTARQPVTVTATIIGPNDPVAQRGMRELIRNATNRGTM